MRGESLFVFGPLRHGGADAAWLAGLPRRAGSVAGELWVLPGGAPVLVPSPRGRVIGELVEGVPPRVLGLLDHLEGVPDGVVTRVRTDVRIGLRSEPAWVWVCDAARARSGRRHPGSRWTPALVR